MVEIHIWALIFVLVLLTVVPLVVVNVLGNRLCSVSYELGRAQGQLAETQKELQDIKAKAQE